MSLPPLSLANVATFKGVDRDVLGELEARLDPIPVVRGDCLVREGDPADALFVVVSGRFAVEIAGQPDPVTEISHGSTVGEIAFFQGGARTATVRAIRDSVVVRLSRSDFDEISQRAPTIWRAITATLAVRLAAETRRAASLNSDEHARKAGPAPRTIAVVAAGGRPIPAAFLSAFVALASKRPGTLVLGGAETGGAANGGAHARNIEALDALESRHPQIVFIADPTLSAWSETAIRQADEVLLLGTPLDEPVGAPVPLNPVESLALRLLPSSAIRLALIHARKGVVQGTRHWLATRAPAMHHHVALDDAASLTRLWRFLCGEALGYVACGGGALTAAHIGIYKAFRERGIEFDLLGGASGGGAMAAAFAQDAAPDDIDASIDRMFVEGRALQRYTLPRYSLIDHAHFDRHLEAQFGSGRIEDLWKPFYAVSADLSRYEIEVHRSGKIWQAIRASAAIPGLLPPFFTDDGRMLVDGSVISNVPIETMHALKRGPNVVVSFRALESQPVPIDYAALPARRDLLWRSLTPTSRRALPPAPSAATVLVRSLMAIRSHFERHLEPGDWLLIPPTPDDMGALDWSRHSSVLDDAYRFALARIDGRMKPDAAPSAAERAQTCST